jgi:BMFP domain-containing protein YqiC
MSVEQEKHNLRAELDDMQLEQLCADEVIAALRKRVAALEARIAALEQQPVGKPT